MKQALELRRLAQNLGTSDDDTAINPLAVYGALTTLIRTRQQLMGGLHSLMSHRGFRRIRFRNSKLQMWKEIAAYNRPRGVERQNLIKSLRMTEAWKTAIKADHEYKKNIIAAHWNLYLRLKNHHEIIENLRSELNSSRDKKIFFWHHYDSLGYVPLSWKAVFEKLQQQGWIIIISSSKIQREEQRSLEASGFLISERLNSGLCLGAYRDFCCLLNKFDKIQESVKCLVLCNDSTLPIGGCLPFCDQIELLREGMPEDLAELSGLTDSMQTKSYHLQSYLLVANQSLIQHKGWNEFWTSFQASGSKDDLIERGEVGLSQSLLKQNIQLKALYSLTTMLLHSENPRPELHELDVRQPEQINLTLMCWKSLLKAKFPLIKKQLLLEPPLTFPRVVPMSELSEHLTEEDKLLRLDLERLVQSRFFTP